MSTPLTDYSVSLFAFITAGLTSIVSRGVASGEDEDELNGKVYGALFIAGASSLADATARQRSLPTPPPRERPRTQEVREARPP